jgi:protocatechuate 3,4-dioxygenase beta subunit
MSHDPYARPPPGGQPPYLHREYGSTVKRAPSRALLPLRQTLSEVTGPRFRAEPELIDLTRQGKGEALGQRIVLAGRLIDEGGRPARRTLVELWQCNAAGRYLHGKDQHDAPLDPNFTGIGRAMTNDEGEYRFLTILPGAYPWRNTYNAWRPAHIHFSLFGPAFLTRMVTQMYFPGDPLLEYDPMYNSIADRKARVRLISAFDWENTVPEWALAYRFDIVLRGRDATPMGR